MGQTSPDKILRLGKTSATGSYHLLIGVAASNIIMAVGSYILARLLLPEEYGLYSIALIPSSLISLFRDWGVNSALTKYVATFRAEHKEAEIRDLLYAGLIFEVALGLGLSFLSLFLADSIASAIFHRPESASLIAIVSLTIFTGALSIASQSSFVGFERMELNSFTAVCQAVVKSTTGPILVILGYGVLGAVFGYTLSIVAVCIISLAILYFAFLRKLPSRNQNVSKTFDALKKMLKYGVPLQISSIMGGFLGQFYSFIMVFFIVDTALIGNFNVAMNFTVLLTFVTGPIATVLFPAFAKTNPQSERELIRTIFSSSVKYTTLLLAPVALAIFALSSPLVNTLFQGKYPYAPFFLSMSAATSLVVVLGSLSLGSFLSGLGETRMQMKLSFLTILFGLPIALLLIPTLGVVGVIAVSVVAGLPSLLLGLLWIRKHYGAEVDLKASARILVASGVAAAGAYIPLILLNSADWIRLAFGIAIFLPTYLLVAPLIGAVNQTDIDNLRVVFSETGLLSSVINVALRLAEKACRTRQK